MKTLSDDLVTAITGVLEQHEELQNAQLCAVADGISVITTGFGVHAEQPVEAYISTIAAGIAKLLVKALVYGRGGTGAFGPGAVNREALIEILAKLKSAQERWGAEQIDDSEEMWSDIPEMLDELVPKMAKALGFED